MENAPKEINDLNNEEKDSLEQPTIFSDISVDYSAYEKNIRNARNWLFFIGAVQIIMGVVQYFKLDNYADNVRWLNLGFYVIIGLAFIGLAVLSYKQPMTAFIAGLILYIVVNIWSIYASEGSILSTYWILKIIVIIALIKAIKDAREYAALKKGLENE